MPEMQQQHGVAMKIPASAWREIQRAAVSMLPYEGQFEPISQESKTLIQISKLLIEKIDEFKDLEGFLWFVTKKVDGCEVKQKALHDLFLGLDNIIIEYKNEIE